MFNNFEMLKYASIREEAARRAHFDQKFGTGPSETERWRASIREWQMAGLEEDEAYGSWAKALGIG